MTKYYLVNKGSFSPKSKREKRNRAKPSDHRSSAAKEHQQKCQRGRKEKQKEKDVIEVVKFDCGKQSVVFDIGLNVAIYIALRFHISKIHRFDFLDEMNVQTDLGGQGDTSGNQWFSFVLKGEFLEFKGFNK